MRLSATTLKRWMNCPLQEHFYRTIERDRRQNAKASFGTIIHHCLDEYSKGVEIETCVDLFKDLWHNPDRLGVTPDYWPKFTSYGSLREKGVDILRLYAEKAKWDASRVIASEYHFLVPFGDHELHGFVDRLEVKKAGNGRRSLRVIDFKTNSKAPTQVDLRLDQQFTVYVYATMQPEFWLGNGPDFPGMPNGAKLMEELENTPRRGVWYHLMTNKELDAGPRDDGDFMRLYRVANEIAKATEAQIFVPKIGETCIWCDYTVECGITIPDRDQVEDEVL